MTSPLTTKALLKWLLNLILTNTPLCMAGAFLIGRITNTVDWLYKENFATALHFSAFSSPCQVLLEGWAISGHSNHLTQLPQAGWAKPHPAPSAQRRERGVVFLQGERPPTTAVMVRLSHKRQAALGCPCCSQSWGSAHCVHSCTPSTLRVMPQGLRWEPRARHLLQQPAPAKIQAPVSKE